MKSPKNSCPCDGGHPYQNCCQPYHDGISAPTAEALMRSRYTAYVMGLEEYLLQTWHKNTRPDSLNLHEEPKPQWLGLEIKDCKTLAENRASVEFIARYKVNGKAQRLQEVSLFEKSYEQWLYVSGHYHT